MAQQLQFSIEDLKQHPEYASFALALEERLRESEIKRRNASLAIFGFGVPVVLSVAAGVYGLAERAIDSAVSNARNEIIASIPNTVRSEIDREISEDFQNSLVLKISDRATENAKNSYKLAASISQLTATVNQIDAGNSFSNSDASLAVSALRNAVELGALEDSSTSSVIVSAGSKLAASFSSADRADFLTQVTSILGSEVALKSQELTLAVATSLGRKLAGDRTNAKSWDQDEVELFDAAVAKLSSAPELAIEWQLIVMLRESVDLGDPLANEKVSSLLSDVGFYDDKSAVGKTVVNVALLSQPALMTKGGRENLSARDRRLAALGRQVLENHSTSLTQLLETFEARNGARSLLKLVANLNSDETSANELRAFLEIVCTLHPDLCSEKEDENFAVFIEYMR